MKNSLIIKFRVRRMARKQRKLDREWLAKNPSFEDLMAERNRRNTEWAKHQVAQMGKDEN